MSEHSKIKLTLTPDWAYGEKGLSEWNIPPNATLIFELEIIHWGVKKDPVLMYHLLGDTKNYPEEGHTVTINWDGVVDFYFFYL